MPPPRICIVEDERITAQHLQESLQAMGYEARCMAFSGEEALRVISETNPDLVLMDIKLGGGIDGIEVARLMRASFNIPVVYLTAFADPALIERAKDTRPLGYVLKPFRVRDLQTTIEIALHNSRLEKQLLESEAKYKELVESANSVIAKTDLEGRITFINEYGLRFFGFTEEEILGKHVVGTMIPDRESTGRDLDAMFRDLLAYPDTFVVNENEIVRRNGERVWLSWTNKAVRDREGQVVGVLGVGQDITDRKRAEEELARALAELDQRVRDRTAELTEANQKLREEIAERRRVERDFLEANFAFDTVVNCSPEPIVGLDEEGIVRVWNPAAERILGWTADEVIGRLYPAVPPDKAGEFQRIQETVFSRGLLQGMEVKRRRKDGVLLDMLLSAAPLLDSDGRMIGSMGILVDLTQRRQSEEQIHELHELNEKIINNSPLGILVYRADGQCVLVNQAAARMVGGTREQLLSQNFRDLKSFAQSGLLEEAEKALATGEDRSLEFHVVTTFGKNLFGEAHCARFNAAGSPHLLLLINDVTHRIDLERQLQQAQKMEAVGTLAGGIAHDFNNLLTVVLGYAELLASEEGVQEAVRADLDKIIRAARGGADLVQGILTFSRKVETKPGPLNLNHHIDNLRKMLARTVPKMIDIKLRLADDLRHVNADAAQMNQVLMNLAVNARDAMPEGGTLTIATRNATLDSDFCYRHPLTNPGEYVELTVTDTGHGMDEETVAHIFEPFFTTKSVGKGTGLGLAIVYGIVRQHCGQILCSSEVGRGTTFTIFLPALVTNEESDEAPLQVMPGGGRETILLVDDEALIRELAMRFLTRGGYRILEAASGEDAIEIYRSSQAEISLVILDLIMPGMGGKQCLKRLREINPMVPVLVASGVPLIGEADAIKKRVQGIVGKPYDFRKLLQAVRDALD